MFYIPAILAKKMGQLSLICLLCPAVFRRIVFDTKWKPPRRVLLGINIQEACDMLHDKIPSGVGEIKFSLYLLSQLTYGIVLVVHKQGELLCRDVQAYIHTISPRGDADKNEKKRRRKRKSDSINLTEQDFVKLSPTSLDEEHMDIVLRQNAFTLNEDFPSPQLDMYTDDFGPLTERESSEMEAVLKGIKEIKFGEPGYEKDDVVIDSTSFASKRERLIRITKMITEKRLKSLNRDSEHDAKTVEPYQLDHLSSTELILSSMHSLEESVPRKKRRKQGVIIDNITEMTNVDFQAQLDCTADLLCTREEMIVQVAKHKVVTPQDLFQIHPVTLREHAKRHPSNFLSCDGMWNYEEPMKLRFREAMKLGPQEAPHVGSVSESIKRAAGVIMMEEQLIFGTRSENVEQARKSTYTTTPMASVMHTFDPSSRLKSESGPPPQKKRFSDLMKISVGSILGEIDDSNQSKRCMDNSLLTAGGARIIEMLSSLNIDPETSKLSISGNEELVSLQKISVAPILDQVAYETSVEKKELGGQLKISMAPILDETDHLGRRKKCMDNSLIAPIGTHLPSITEADQRDAQQDVPEENVPHSESVKISMMTNMKQLKVDLLDDETDEDNSILTYGQILTTSEFLRYLRRFIDSKGVSTVLFSELVRGSSRMCVVRAFTALLSALYFFIIRVGQLKNPVHYNVFKISFS
ncbi:unnamed protein product [Thelazia callipaeda]|uniref:Rad21_Rec8_N domain-containing protein n=1 Tax=Thelazia callipaeda TaxID=103827 RepID=A0A158RBZ5_THECL|nr:unnamed protein product [Thelazia callipaeda]